MQTDQHAYPTGPLLSDRKAAALARCPARRWAQMREMGQGPAYFVFSTRRYYRKEDVLAWLESRRVDPSLSREAA